MPMKTGLKPDRNGSVYVADAEGYPDFYCGCSLHPGRHSMMYHHMHAVVHGTMEGLQS